MATNGGEGPRGALGSCADGAWPGRSGGSAVEGACGAACWCTGQVLPVDIGRGWLLAAACEGGCCGCELGLCGVLPPVAAEGGLCWTTAVEEWLLLCEA